MSKWPVQNRRVRWAQGRHEKKAICWVYGEMTGGRIQGHEVVVARGLDERVAKEIVERLNAWEEIKNVTMGEITHEIIQEGAGAIDKRLRMMRLKR